MKNIYSILSIFLFFSLITVQAQFSVRDEASVMIQKGDNYMSFGNWELAEDEYLNAIVLDNSFEVPYMKVARLYKMLGRYSESMNYYNQAISINPYSEVLYNERAAIKVLSLNYSGALSDLNNALSIAPQNNEIRLDRVDDLMLVESYENAIADLDTLLANGFEKEFYLLRKSKVLLLNGEFDEAGVVLDSVLSINPLSFESFDLWGIIKMKKGFNQVAIEYFNKAIEINKDFDIAHFNKGLAYLKLNDKVNAKKCIDAAIDLNTKNEHIYFARALVKKEMSDFQGALADYDAALQLNPNYKSALYNRVYTKKTLGDYSSALIDIEQLLESDNTSAEYWNSLGNVQMLHGDYFEAEKSFTEAIKIDSDYLDAIFNRGLAFVFSNRSMAGCQDLEYCVDHDYDKALRVFQNFCGF